MVFESFLTLSRTQARATSPYREQTVAFPGLALDRRDGDVYNEEAFRHLLTVERLRAERSERSCLLLLVNLRRCPKSGVRVSRAQSAAIFAALAQCVREVDFIGWHRDERVAGAVLTQGMDAPAPDVPARIIDRVTTILGRRLPVSVAQRLRMRVVRLGTGATS